MRNRASAIIILVCVVLLVLLAFRGLAIGKIEILSIAGLNEKNQILEEKIEEASELTSKKYPQNIDALDETYDEYMIKKQKYNDLIGVAGKVDKEIYETKQYDIGYLWRVLGKYATNRSLALGIDVQKNTIGNSSYNFNFTVSGRYVNISQFITDLENDSDLYFRIYNFKMSGSGEMITSTFTVRNVNIDPSTIS